MTFISHAQNFEDVTLFRALKHVERGFYIDVGAHDPIRDSVTKAFYDRGWRGINIEPVSEWYEKLVAERPEDINLNVALSERAGVLTLHEVAGTGMSTAKDVFIAAHRDGGHAIRDIRVPAITLDSVWVDCAVTEVHFLKIDVEGAEGDVLSAIDLDVRRPWIILLEATLPNSMQPCHGEWEEQLTSRNYVFVYFDGLNRFYVAKEREQALRANLSLPPNLFDQFIRRDDWNAHEGVAELSATLIAERAASTARETQHADRLSELESKSQQLSSQDDRLREAHVDLEVLRTTIQRLQDEALIHGDQTASLQSSLLELRQAMTSLEDEAQKSAVRTEALESALVDVGNQRRASEEETAQAVAKANLLLQTTVARYESQLRESTGQLATVGTKVTHLERVVSDERSEAAFQRVQRQATNSELQAVYGSLSWRLTEPLRKGNAAVKKSVRPVLEKALHLTRTHRGLRSFAAGTSIAPPVYRRLKAFAAKRPLIVSPDAEQAPRSDRPASVVSPATSIQEGASEALSNATVVYYYVDHTVRCPVNTGMQRIVRGLAKSLSQLGHVVRFVKWDLGAGQLVFISKEELGHLALWNGPGVPDADQSLYCAASEKAIAIPDPGSSASSWLFVPEVPYINYHDVSLTLDLLLEAKRLGLQSLCIFYDAIPLRRAEMASFAPTHESYMRALLLADVVTPISEWSGAELAAFFTQHECAASGPTPYVRAVPCPGESNLAVRATGSLPLDSHLILCVGTVETRKNQLTLIAAFDEFTSAHPAEAWRLVLIGNIHPEVHAAVAEAQQRNPGIEVLGNVSDGELRDYYEQCAFTVFPSIEEGFGLPIAESLWHGKPCICANFGAMAELGAGGGCLLVDTRDCAELRAAIQRLAFDVETRARLTQEATSRPLSTFENYATSVMQTANESADSFARLGTIYYCVEHTSTFPYNTGIQRVVRGLADAFMSLKLKVVPVKWNAADHVFYSPSPEELSHLSEWNGPAPAAWAREPVPETFHASDWLVMPELTAYPGGPDLREVKAYSVSRGLRVAWVFYDTIPWKMRASYNPVVAQLHRDYLERLNDFELIMAISEFSRGDLATFLAAQPFRTTGLSERLVACKLPGELKETERVGRVKEPSQTVAIVCIGSVETRKNQLALLRAFNQAQTRTSTSMTLRIAGGCHLPAPDESVFRTELAKTSGATWEESVDDARLHALLDQCDFTVYPSIEEGFGLPILESLWNARPCICRNTGAMAEVAEGGGCLQVDTTDIDQLATAIVRLADDKALRRRLAQEATRRPFRTWIDYGREFATALARERFVAGDLLDPARRHELSERRRGLINVPEHPTLSICITTYNRGAWLDASLRNLVRLIPEALPDVEIVVCDNASTDNTQEVMAAYLERRDLRYFRNADNVGMLGNLKVTTQHARGRHVWILGDDDLLLDGAVEKVLALLKTNPDIALLYLNYSYTREDDAASAADLPAFLAQGTPIVPPGPDHLGTVRSIATLSENFFTAIYCLVFRRDHALRAYSQDTSGRPFSSMLTSIPTTHHVLNFMMDEPACWVGEPLLIVNMNVSWLKYAPLWILERLPEMFDLAERLGADQRGVDRWRSHSMENVVIYFKEILNSDVVGNADLFDPARLVTRYKHLDAFRSQAQLLSGVYDEAHRRNAVGAERPTAEVFAAFSQVQHA